MARTTSTNFTGVLDFTVATASTDLFKKEDVQVLAQAVDQHDHSAGKGLQISTAAIPNGSITSAMIADGAIGTADLASGATMSLLGVSQALASFSTTTTGSYVATGIAVTGTPSGTAGAFVLITCGVTITHSALGAVTYAAIYRDGVVIGAAAGVYQNAVANENKSMFIQLYDTPSAAPHTWELRFNNSNAGTLTINGAVLTTMQVLELKR